MSAHNYITQPLPWVQEAFHAQFPVSVKSLIAARVFGLRPNTCRPVADEAPRRTREKTSVTQGTQPRARQQKPVANLKNIPNQTGARKCQKRNMKKINPKHYTTMRMKTNRQDSNVYLKFLFIRELVVSPVVQARHFTALALERQVLEPLTSAASELHRSVEAFFIRGVLC